MKFGFIGVGVMAGAMLEGALRAGFLRPGQAMAYDKRPGAAEKYGVPVAASASELAAQCDAVQLGCKPQDQPALLEEIDEALAANKKRPNTPLLISIAAGIPLARITPWAPRAVRLVPNINATVGESMTAYCAAPAVTPEELAFVQGYCECFGRALPLEEKYVPAFFVLSGSAPAFVYLFIDELARAGVAAGLPKALALEIAAQTALGSAQQVRQNACGPGAVHPYDLIDRVCSPGGMTIAGIHALREHGFEHAVAQGVLAALRREQELGK
jgi:pyrroline-5-carboxylate reductase